MAIIDGNANPNTLMGDPDGTPSEDMISGFGGNDKLFGKGEKDILAGGAGADLLDGGLGYDAVWYLESAIGLVVNLLDPSQNTGIAKGDTYVSVEYIAGSSHDDKLFGNNGNNGLSGGEGDDRLIGHGGDDTLIGNAGADALSGRDGSDTAAYYTDNDGPDTLIIDLAVPKKNTGAAAGDTYSSIENVDGSFGADVIRGNVNANTLSGVVGNDYLEGRGGADKLEGGKGVDFAIYDTSKASVTADLAGALSNTGDAAGDTYFSIENLAGTSFNDKLYGNDKKNSVVGYQGNDWLSGRDGNDALLGGAGNDKLFGGKGDDTLNGAAGKDQYVFNTALNAATNVDTIDDMSLSYDKIALDDDVFTAVGGTGMLAAAMFHEGAAAADIDDRIIYRASTGALFYDADGLDGQAQVKFAQLDNNLALDNTHFTVVA